MTLHDCILLSCLPFQNYIYFPHMCWKVRGGYYPRCSYNQIFTFLRLNRRKLTFFWGFEIVHYRQFHIAQRIWIWILTHCHVLTMWLSFYSSFAAKNICNSRNKVINFFTLSVSAKMYVISYLWCHCENAEFILCYLLLSFSRHFAVLIYWNSLANF